MMELGHSLGFISPVLQIDAYSLNGGRVGEKTLYTFGMQEPCRTGSGCLGGVYCLTSFRHML